MASTRVITEPLITCFLGDKIIIGFKLLVEFRMTVVNANTCKLTCHDKILVDLIIIVSRGDTYKVTCNNKLLVEFRITVARGHTCRLKNHRIPKVRVVVTLGFSSAWVMLLSQARYIWIPEFDCSRKEKSPGAPVTYFNDGGGDPSDFFGSEILAKSDLFWSMKDAGIFLGSRKKTEEFF